MVSPVNDTVNAVLLLLDSTVLKQAITNISIIGIVMFINRIKYYDTRGLLAQYKVHFHYSISFKIFLGIIENCR